MYRAVRSRLSLTGLRVPWNFGTTAYLVLAAKEQDQRNRGSLWKLRWLRVTSLQLNTAQYQTATDVDEYCGCPLTQVKFSWINCLYQFWAMQMQTFGNWWSKNSEILGKRSCCGAAIILAVASQIKVCYKAYDMPEKFFTISLFG